MTDDLATHLLVTHLRSIDHMSLEDCFLQSPYFIKAADRLVTLAAERDEAINQLDSAIHSKIVLEKRTAAVVEDRKLIVQERDRTFALMLARVEKAEADNARLREIGTEMAESIEGNYYLPGVATRWRAAIAGKTATEAAA